MTSESLGRVQNIVKRDLGLRRYCLYRGKTLCEAAMKNRLDKVKKFLSMIRVDRLSSIMWTDEKNFTVVVAQNSQNRCQLLTPGNKASRKRRKRERAKIEEQARHSNKTTEQSLPQQETIFQEQTVNTPMTQPKIPQNKPVRSSPPSTMQRNHLPGDMPPSPNRSYKLLQALLGASSASSGRQLKTNLLTEQSSKLKPVLHLYQVGLPCRLYCDASTQVIAGILKQVHPDGQVHHIQYLSRVLRAHERIYTVSELECLAILESVDKFRIYLTASHITNSNPFNIDTNGLHTITRKIIIPETLQHTLMNKVHQEYNHPGISQMTRIITTQYYCKGISKSIEKFVRSCHTCQIIKRPKGKLYGALGLIPPPQQPFDLISIDTIAGFSKYGHSKTYLHVIVDHLTRFAWTFPSKSTGTRTYIQTLKTVLKQGFPKCLLSDRAPAFTSEKFRKFLITHGKQPLLTTSNNPQANDSIERLNSTITGKLKLAYLENSKASWTQLVKRITQTEEFGKSLPSRSKGAEYRRRPTPFAPVQSPNSRMSPPSAKECHLSNQRQVADPQILECRAVQPLLQKMLAYFDMPLNLQNLFQKPTFVATGPLVTTQFPYGLPFHIPAHPDHSAIRTATCETRDRSLIYRYWSAAPCHSCSVRMITNCDMPLDLQDLFNVGIHP
ncbi:hypothetical protein LAZ67_15001448 [Cordylochernes scorpioides]|uniref:RNA-directed DNA polymerase n=1 Tax=Cordylochernes scorpioides TaxID=51811 RepID=A0ABY6L8T7_9ARAC|nr:hypothetical protein LAZ67_15001448 [Cordylochernes scorpioides]